MYIVVVNIHAKPEFVGQFIPATLDNASNTRKEPGNIRFDVIRAEDDPNRFMLYEVYQSKEAFLAHQQTPHYFRWRDTVANWMAQPRWAVKAAPVFFGDGQVAG